MLTNFFENDHGAVSVEFMVGLAAVATLGMAVVMAIDNGSGSVATEINNSFMPLSMDLMNMSVPTVESLSGSSAWNNTQGGQPYSQVNCQHYTMSNGETWKHCTETRFSDSLSTAYWLDATGQYVDIPPGA